MLGLLRALNYALIKSMFLWASKVVGKVQLLKL